MKFARWVSQDAPLLLYGVNVLLTALVAFPIGASQTVTAAVTTIAAAVITGISAFATRPVRIPVITGSVATILTAGAAFGLHLPAQVIGSFIPALAFGLALVMREHISPKPVVPGVEPDRPIPVT
jgi:uncharacterized membrane-anchored protein